MNAVRIQTFLVEMIGIAGLSIAMPSQPMTGTSDRIYMRIRQHGPMSKESHHQRCVSGLPVKMHPDSRTLSVSFRPMLLLRLRR